MVADTQKKQEFLQFLEEYNRFLAETIKAQEKKLEALLSHDLALIEQDVAKQQALSFQMKSMEESRMKKQQEAGFGTLSFQEIMDSLSGVEKEAFQACFVEMIRQVEQIKFLNEKAMRLVETNLQIINMAAPAEERMEARGYDESGKQRDSGLSKEPLLDSKI